MNIRFDDKYLSYKGFFDHEWFEELSKKENDSTLVDKEMRLEYD